MLHNPTIMTHGHAPTPSPIHHQTGGTLVGFVAGLLVGLGVALAVAVYVTKVPIPLVDRGVQRKPAEEAAEAERNKTWNPNAGLGGKAAPATSAPAAAASEAAPAQAQAPATPPQAKPGDPLGALIQSKTDTPKTTPEADPATPDPFVYFVQAGAFKAPEEAESQRAKLAMLGLDAKVTEREQAGRTMYRVRVGPYPQKTEADAVQSRLGGQGFEAALVRVQR